ncbi:cadherin repeat domain-containing protein [Tenacibaculum aestuarii]|uniref:cadherin repeat domain-containing protein n=1 Tax=Tenacibaculum aestuarii TaxID=362781 RepID=UPI003892CDA9
MKNAIQFTKTLFLTLLIITYSCSKDDDPIVINLQNLEVTIDENPTVGQVIGTIESDNNASLIFSITSQTPNGALEINENTGELTVADATLFDFETNPTITATIAADKAQNTATVTISVNNTNELSVQDYTTTVDENPVNGQSLGTVQASGDATLSFSIASQTPAGALSVNASTGELTVADATLFDYETNPTITASIAVSNSGGSENGTVTINLNDVDNIGALLSTSLTNYNAAASGEWVIITETEYDNLASNLSSITRAGTTVSEYSIPYSSAISNLNGSITVSNSTTNLIPINGYLIAFKYKVWNTTNASGVKVKLSNSANNSGFSDIGSSLPTHSGNFEDVFFVLKGNNTPVASNSYLGFFQSTSTLLLFNPSTTNGSYYWGSSDASTLNGQNNGKKVFYQGLSTTQAQW